MLILYSDEEVYVLPRAESGLWFMGMSPYIMGLNLEFKQLYKAMCICFRSQGPKLRGIIMIMILG